MNTKLCNTIKTFVFIVFRLEKEKHEGESPSLVVIKGRFEEDIILTPDVS